MVTRLQDVAGGLSSALAEAPQEAAQACYLPCSPDGHPLVGAIKGVSGAYIASGGPPAHRPPPSPGLRATLSSLICYVGNDPSALATVLLSLCDCADRHCMMTLTPSP